MQARGKQESKQRAHLNAYIRQLRNNLEGPKGGQAPKDKWTISKMTVPKRWEQYRESRMRKGLPVIGSLSLFAKLWREHSEIVEISAKGHAKCDRYDLAHSLLAHNRPQALLRHPHSPTHHPRSPMLLHAKTQSLTHIILSLCYTLPHVDPLAHSCTLSCTLFEALPACPP